MNDPYIYVNTGAARHGQGGGTCPPGNVQMGICNPSPEFLAPRMHQNSPFSAQKSKNFLGRGHSPLPRPLSHFNFKWDQNVTQTHQSVHTTQWLLSQFPFNSTSKIAPRMHQNSPFQLKKSKKFSWEGALARRSPVVASCIVPASSLCHTRSALLLHRLQGRPLWQLIAHRQLESGPLWTWLWS